MNIAIANANETACRCNTGKKGGRVPQDQTTQPEGNAPQSGLPDEELVDGHDVEEADAAHGIDQSQEVQQSKLNALGAVQESKRTSVQTDEANRD